MSKYAIPFVLAGVILFAVGVDVMISGGPEGTLLGGLTMIVGAGVLSCSAPFL